MLLTRRELAILLVNLVYVPIFAVMAARGENYEFLLYVVVIVMIGAWLVAKQRRVKFSARILWGLTVWGFLHMAGGNIHIGDTVLYGQMIVTLVPSYDILRYDQVVHMFGFAVATCVCYHVLKPYLREGIERVGTLLLLVVLMGSGLGAINEIIEFIATVVMPETNVGGYNNTALDLCSNLVGGLIAVCYLRWRDARDGGRRLDRTPSL